VEHDHEFAKHHDPGCCEDSPFYRGGARMIALAMTQAEPRIRENFRTGAGMRWAEHDA
jgi:hypothetical protein